MRPAWLFCRNALEYHAVIAGFIAADLLLARIFGQGSIFFIYVNMFQYLFMLMHAICISNICGLYARLALGLGATRRQLVVGYTVATAFSAGVTVLLSLASFAVTPLVLGPISGDTLQAAMGPAMAGGGIWFVLVPMLGAGAAFGWVTILKNRKGWRSVVLIVAVFIAVIGLCLVLPLVVLLMMANGEGGVPGVLSFGVLNTLRWVAMGSGLVLFAVFYALTVRGLRRLAL